jgi:hypothetical protein
MAGPGGACHQRAPQLLIGGCRPSSRMAQNGRDDEIHLPPIGSLDLMQSLHHANQQLNEEESSHQGAGGWAAEGRSAKSTAPNRTGRFPPPLIIETADGQQCRSNQVTCSIAGSMRVEISRSQAASLAIRSGSPSIHQARRSGDHR